MARRELLNSLRKAQSFRTLLGRRFRGNWVQIRYKTFYRCHFGQDTLWLPIYVDQQMRIALGNDPPAMLAASRFQGEVICDFER